MAGDRFPISALTLRCEAGHPEVSISTLEVVVVVQVLDVLKSFVLGSIVEPVVANLARSTLGKAAEDENTDDVGDKASSARITAT